MVDKKSNKDIASRPILQTEYPVRAIEAYYHHELNNIWLNLLLRGNRKVTLDELDGLIMNLTDFRNEVAAAQGKPPLK